MVLNRQNKKYGAAILAEIRTARWFKPHLMAYIPLGRWSELYRNLNLVMPLLKRKQWYRIQSCNHLTT